MSEPYTQAERDTIERDEVARKNSNELMRLIAQHGLFIPNRDLDRWRPCVPTDGMVDGFMDFGSMTCIATDGIQAQFVLADGRVWCGHVQHFRWDVPVVSMVPYVDEKGQQRFFKSVKDHGAPKALFAKTPKMREVKPKVRKSKKPTRKSILADL